MEAEFVTLRCRSCGGVAHPETGHYHTPTFLVCGPCTRRFVQWVSNWTRRGGSRGVPGFYDCVNTVRPPIHIEPV
jgi:hypothetical protein